MRDGIAQEIRDDLRQQTGIALPVQLADTADFDQRGLAGRLAFLDDGARQRQVVVPAGAQLHRAGTDARQVQQLVDHARHALGAAFDALRRDDHLRVVAHHRQQHGAVHHHRQRRAQVVAQHGREQFVEVQRMLELIELGRQFTLLLEQLHQHRHLALQGFHVDRLVQEIDGARLVATETVAWFARRGREENQGNAARAFAAAHQFGQFKTVHLRHLHVDQGQCDFMRQQQFQRLRARTCFQDHNTWPCQHGFGGDQVLRDVVNDEDMDRCGHGIIFRHRNGKMPSCFDMNINIVSILTYITRTALLPFTCVRHHRARPGWRPAAANRARGRRRPA